MSFVPPRLIPPPVDASHVPGVDRPDTMGDPTGFGEAQVVGVRVENSDADKMDSTMKPDIVKYTDEHEGVMNVLHSEVHAKLSAPQREAHFRAIEAELPRACSDVCIMYPEHAASIAPYYACPANHPRPAASVKKSVAERLVFANAYVHATHLLLVTHAQTKKKN